MKTKTFEHQAIEKCNISGKPINTEVDRYCILLECTGNEINSKGFYKDTLMKETIKGNMDSVRKELLEKHQNVASKMIKGLQGVMGIKTPEKQYQIGDSSGI